MEMYLLNSAACLALLMIFYKLVLERSSMHQFKRIYLVAAIILPFLVPLITFTSYVEAADVTLAAKMVTSEASVTDSGFIIPWETILWTIYLSGVALFGTRFAIRLSKIIFRIRKNPKQRYHDIIKVLLPQKIVPHTFLSYIFLNNESDRKNDIPSEVIEHEKVHAREMHSIDVLMVELAKVIFWFNPLFNWLGNSIKLNHEFLADRSVLKKGYPVSEYQETILAYSSHATVPKMAHSINYSSLKKRFTVMRTNTSRRASILRSLLIVPLLAFIIYGFSTTEVIQIPDSTSKQTISTIGNNVIIRVAPDYSMQVNGIAADIETLPKVLKSFNTHLNDTDRAKYVVVSFEKYESMTPKIMEELKSILFEYGVPTHELGTRFYAGSTNSNTDKFFNEWRRDMESNRSNLLKEQQSATREEMKEYNKLARKYNSMKKEEREYKIKELKRMEYIYNKMSDKQRADSEPFPEIVPPPPPPPPPPGEAPRLAAKVAPKVVGSVPPPPPPPKAPNPTEDFDKLLEKGQKYYLNGKEISKKQAKALEKQQAKLKTIHVVREDDGKTVIYFEN